MAVFRAQLSRRSRARRPAGLAELAVGRPASRPRPRSPSRAAGRRGLEPVERVAQEDEPPGLAVRLGRRSAGRPRRPGRFSARNVATSRGAERLEVAARSSSRSRRTPRWPASGRRSSPGRRGRRPRSCGSSARPTGRSRGRRPCGPARRRGGSASGRPCELIRTRPKRLTGSNVSCQPSSVAALARAVRGRQDRRQPFAPPPPSSSRTRAGPSRRTVEQQGRLGLEEQAAHRPVDARRRVADQPAGERPPRPVAGGRGGSGRRRRSGRRLVSSVAIGPVAGEGEEVAVVAEPVVARDAVGEPRLQARRRAAWASSSARTSPNVVAGLRAEERLEPAGGQGDGAGEHRGCRATRRPRPAGSARAPAGTASPRAPGLRPAPRLAHDRPTAATARSQSRPPGRSASPAPGTGRPGRAGRRGGT